MDGLSYTYSDLLADDEIDQWLQTCKEHMNMECNRFISTPMKGLTSIGALCCRSETPATKAANLSNAVSAESRKRDFMDCGNSGIGLRPPLGVLRQADMHCGRWRERHRRRQQPYPCMESKLALYMLAQSWRLFASPRFTSGLASPCFTSCLASFLASLK